MSSRIRVAVGMAVVLVATACSASSGSDDAAERADNGDTTPPTAVTTDAEETDDGVTTAETGGAAPDVDAAPVEPVDWTDCGGGLECGSVPVPLNHDDADGAVLDIALVRVPAAGEAVGSIFVNPGGPGASGVDFVRDGFRFDDETARRYHLIGFDPRGIGQSNPLACSVDRADDPLADLSPDSAEESALLDREAAEIVADCASSDGAILPHLTTTDVARDLDRLRQAVGDESLHYYGLSYGTLLAVRYGSLFPDAVGHMVLDGVVDPSAGLLDLLRQQAAAFETGFASLDERCDESRCPSDGITATFDRVHDRLEAGGPVGGVGASELVIASLLPAYSPSIFPAYATALDQADGGNYTAIEMLSDFFVSSISFTAYAAFACADGRPPSGPDPWARFAAELDELAPRFGAVVANELRVCAFWPAADPDSTPAETTADDLAGVTVPVLVVGNTGDAATPLANAERVADLLPDARLVVVDSRRHTAYNGSACVRALVADYFADRPIAGTSRCSDA